MPYKRFLSLAAAWRARVTRAFFEFLLVAILIKGAVEWRGEQVGNASVYGKMGKALSGKKKLRGLGTLRQIFRPPPDLISP